VGFIPTFNSKSFALLGCGIYPHLLGIGIIIFLGLPNLPRKSNFFISKIPVHLVIRGNSRKTIFAEEEYQFYRKWLLERSGELDCEIYSYVLMTNHVYK
jgi:hypothetical protein